MFTLNNLTSPLRRMPRDAVIKIGCPDGSVAGVARVKPRYMASDESESVGTADGARHMIVLVAEVR